MPKPSGFKRSKSRIKCWSDKVDFHWNNLQHQQMSAMGGSRTRPNCYSPDTTLTTVSAIAIRPMGETIISEITDATRPLGQLHKVLGLSFALAIGVGTVIGAGIMRTPGAVVDTLPVLELVMALWLFGGIHCMLVANTASELATTLPKAGGLYVPVRAAFGQSAGLLTGWVDWLAYVAGMAALAVVSAEFLALLLPSLQDHIALVAAAFGMASVALNILGVKEGAAVQIVGSLLKFLFLCGIIGIILFSEPLATSSAASTTISESEAFGFFAIIVAYQLIYGAFAGWTAPVYFAEEDVETPRNIPRGLVLSLITITVVYLLINASLFHALPIEQFGQSELPVSDALANIFGPLGGKIVAGGALLLTASCLNSSVMVVPRILYGMGRDGLFPKIATRVNKGGTPDIALGLSAVLMIILVFTGGFEFLFRLMGALTILVLVLYQASLFGLRRSHPELERPYRAKLYPILPALVLMLDIGLLAAFLIADWFSGIVLVALVSISIPIGHYLSRQRTNDENVDQIIDQ